MKEKTCCFTGHREFYDSITDIEIKLKHELERLIGLGFEQFIVGGAKGFDTIAAQAVLLLKKEYPAIQLILAIPCLGQTRGWSEHEKEIYNQIRNAADQEIVLADHYYRGCMQARNRYMVDRSAVCVCYLRKDSGGSAYTVAYAKKKNVQLIEI